MLTCEPIERRTLRGAPPIIPQDSWAKNLISLIKQNRSMHLP
jgi:hypothetical protein